MIHKILKVINECVSKVNLVNNITKVQISMLTNFISDFFADAGRTTNKTMRLLSIFMLQFLNKKRCISTFTGHIYN